MTDADLVLLLSVAAPLGVFLFIMTYRMRDGRGGYCDDKPSREELLRRIYEDD